MGKDKALNPAEQFRKEQKKKEIQKSKKEQKELHKIQELLNDPRKIEEEIEKLRKESEANRLDKSIKDKIKEYSTMLELAVKKEKLRNEALKLKGGTIASTTTTASSSSSSSSLTTRTAPEATPSIPIPQATLSSTPIGMPQDSIYYHPTYNPTAIPPPGQPQVYKPKPPVAFTSLIPLPSRPSLPIRPVMAMGGVNGVPLPPPLPPQGSRPVSTMAHQHATQSRPHASKGRTVVDPLDPTNEHYTQRFQTKFTEAPPPPPPPTIQAPNAMIYSVETVQLDVPTDSDELDGGDEGAAAMTAEEEEEARLVEERLQRLIGAPTSTPLPPPPPPLPAASPPPVAFVPPPSQAPIAPSMAELIMRRRHLLADESAAPAAPSGPSSVLSAEAVNNAPKKVAVVNPLSSLLGAYGDDDDDDEDDNSDDMSDEAAPLPSVGELSDIAGPALPSLFIQYDALSSQFPDAPTAPDFYQPSSSESLEIPKPAKLLKVVKADSALTAFLPSALRGKRASESASKGPVVKAARVAESAVSATPSSSVDAAYQDFLQEIGQL